MNLMKQMISTSGEDTNKLLVELKKDAKHDAQHRKEWKSITEFQIEIQKVKNITESMSNRSNQCQDTVSDLEDRAVVNDQFMRDTFKTK